MVPMDWNVTNARALYSKKQERASENRELKINYQPDIGRKENAEIYYSESVNGTFEKL